MRVAPWYVCLLLMLPAHIPASATAVCAQEPLRINEFTAGPARDWDGNGVFSSRDDEWVEVVNTGITSLDLSGFILTDGDSIPRYAFSGSLAPGDHRVVYGGESHAWEQANGQPAFGFSLANTGDAVILWHVVNAETLVVDNYVYKSHEAAADRAVGRSPDGSGTWVIFDALNPYTGATPPQGNACAPTPGNPNLCTSTPTAHTTWGRMKTLYR